MGNSVTEKRATVQALASNEPYLGLGLHPHLAHVDGKGVRCAVAEDERPPWEAGRVCRRGMRGHAMQKDRRTGLSLQICGARRVNRAGDPALKETVACVVH